MEDIDKNVIEPKNQKIYIMLSYTGTIPSKIIKWRTGNKFSHTSISLDDNLDNMYSFARKGIYNPLNAGFIKEDIRNGVFKRKPKTEIAVFGLDVTTEQYNGISKVIDEFVSIKNKVKYNFMALSTMIFFEYKKEVTNKYFCSGFVATVLKTNNINLFNKDSCIVFPQDFYEPLKNTGELIYEGNILSYPKYNLSKEIITEENIEENYIPTENIYQEIV